MLWWPKMTNDPAEDIEDMINEFCMNGRIGPGGELPSSWILVVDVGDEVTVYQDRYSKPYAAMGLCDYTKQIVLASEFNDGRGLL